MSHENEKSEIKKMKRKLKGEAEKNLFYRCDHCQSIFTELDEKLDKQCLKNVDKSICGTCLFGKKIESVGFFIFLNVCLFIIPYLFYGEMLYLIIHNLVSQNHNLFIFSTIMNPMSQHVVFDSYFMLTTTGIVGLVIDILFILMGLAAIVGDVIFLKNGALNSIFGVFKSVNDYQYYATSTSYSVDSSGNINQHSDSSKEWHYDMGSRIINIFLLILYILLVIVMNILGILIFPIVILFFILKKKPKNYLKYKTILNSCAIRLDSFSDLSDKEYKKNVKTFAKENRWLSKNEYREKFNQEIQRNFYLVGKNQTYLFLSRSSLGSNRSVEIGGSYCGSPILVAYLNKNHEIKLDVLMNTGIRNRKKRYLRVKFHEELLYQYAEYVFPSFFKENKDEENRMIDYQKKLENLNQTKLKKVKISL